MYGLLSNFRVDANNLLVTFTDLSWNDDVDDGRSTGSFLVFYMGGVVEQNIN